VTPGIQAPARTGGSIIKRLLVGRPLATEDAGHQLLPKILALPVFSSDALSSVAYATEEIMIVLSAAGVAALTHTPKIAIAIATLLFIVVVSYRQTVRAYPSGGGAYIVSRENLGVTPGLVAAGALLVDYVLTVAVSIVAGVDAIASAAPVVAHHKVIMAVGFITLITLANLRGVRESGSLFAIPTYVFIVSIFIMLGVGALKCIGGCPTAHVDPRLREALAVGHAPLTLFLILKAFSSGSTALTGVEAISNGVPAFRRPQAKNAASTLAIMGTIAITMFLGISFLANKVGALPHTSEVITRLGIPFKTIVAQTAEAVFGKGATFFYVIQVATAAILILAANTAYQDFPRLSSILARDRFMPRQFMSRGDRLVFSNGIAALALMAILLVWVFDADTTRLIQLYVVGVFTSFTLSQTGMVRHWLKLRSRGWRRSAIINGIGAFATGVVLIVITATKFTHGAWIVVTAIPFIVMGFRGIHRHYESVSQQLRKPEERPKLAGEGVRVVIPVARLDDATLRAIGYAKTMRPRSIHAVHVGSAGADDLALSWERWRMGFPLDVVAGDDVVEGVRAYIRRVERTDGDFLNVIIPETLRRGGWGQFLKRRRALLLKTAMLFERDIVVTDIPSVETPHRAPEHRPPAPARNEVVILISAVHNASLRAVAYATALRPTGIRAVTFNVDPTETERVMGDWVDSRVNVPLEILDSPYREVRKPLLRFARSLKTLPGTVVTIVIPEFVVGKWWHQFLHNQTALAIKATMLFEPDTVVSSVPYHID
jgi:amino acid transporter